ncbi:26897_t:CDS:1, partial [Gigaspora margarita]
TKKQILECDKIKPESVELKHPNDYYSSKLINTTQFDSKMQDLAIDNLVDDSN